MAKRICIVGDLPSRPNRIQLLDAATQREPDIEWDWVQSVTPAFNLPPKPFNRLLALLRNPPENLSVVVVKLACLNGKDTHALYAAHPQPILAPIGLDSNEELLDWLLSEEAALVKEPQWTEPSRAAALLAILAKLLRNKSWNKDQNGHQWTQEADLLGQAPVKRPDGLLYAEAPQLLQRMQDELLLTKGGKQGKTKKEWCISLGHLPTVKQVILGRSLEPFREVEVLLDLMVYVDDCTEPEVLVDGDIVNETVRYHCRSHR